MHSSKKQEKLGLFLTALRMSPGQLKSGVMHLYKFFLCETISVGGFT